MKVVARCTCPAHAPRKNKPKGKRIILGEGYLSALEDGVGLYWADGESKELKGLDKLSEYQRVRLVVEVL